MGIGESNKRQSDYLWGYEDGTEGRLTRSQSPDYLRGYDASFKELGPAPTHEGVAGASDNDRLPPGRSDLCMTPAKVAKVPRFNNGKLTEGEKRRVANGVYFEHINP